MREEQIEQIIDLIVQNSEKVINGLNGGRPEYAEQVYLNLLRKDLLKLNPSLPE